MVNFMVLPPEINSVLMFSGAGSAPMLEAAAAWDGLASELGSAASSFSSVTSGLVGQAWQGPASQAMAAAATPYTGQPSGVLSGFNSGLLNMGTGIAGLFNLMRVLP
jgi:hypothetical protein